MAFYAGKSGTVAIDGGAAQSLTDWSIDVKSDAIETTSFTSTGYAEHVYGPKSCDISASGPYDGAAGGQPGEGDFVAFALNVGGGHAGFGCNALITSVKIDQSVKDVAKISYTATSTGTITITV
jgi:hypothetical protein